ncbi:MAG: DUF455 domain-containing protein [Verrucomicrobia bacterium]|nr:MAG: DUF455 domain-containing protein [Verrucomicrobiota bacterium]
MELRQFAEQVLFSTDLDEKLRIPESVTDDNPGLALEAPGMPGRPRELVFKAGRSSHDSFPGLNRLEKDSERGRLLHFFANHELLATELMALVLLRFPGAPSSFRQGVFSTLKDEQRHTRLYLRRMEACGVQFGELPVSGYFWRTISPMENPVDYVAGLCLTFEQANLDFCRHYARGFSQVGDTSSGRLLDRIYHDEIGHVAYGLKWFRRWKNPDESDWEAFCRHLQFPLSPQRAKGIGFNRSGRQAAGFDPDFIAELEVYSRSRGRTPTVTLFNPLTEAVIARGKGFSPGRRQRQLVDDLTNLPQFLCHQDDIILVRTRPSLPFLRKIKRAGFPLPEFVELTDGPIDISELLAHRKLGRLRPWAWGPDSLELLAPLSRQLGEKSRPADQSYHEKITPLYSKSWSADFLRSILAGQGAPSWLCEEGEVGVTVSTLDAALECIAGLRGRGRQRLVVKQVFGLAGQSALRLWEPGLLETQRRWMRDALESGLSLVIEPWLDRVIDFSIQMEADPETLRICGYTGLVNDHRGQFEGNWATATHARRLPAQVTDRLRPQVGDTDRIYQLFEEVWRELGLELRKRGYQGPVGVDAFVYRTPQGMMRLKPVVEINPRFTMGRLTVELMKQVSPGRNGFFRLFNRAEIEKAGHESLPRFAKELDRRFPLRLGGNPKPKIRSGALCLNDPTQSSTWLAIFAVGRDLKGLQSLL